MCSYDFLVCTLIKFAFFFKYSSLIRWPFEKTGYLNKKADFIRVHSKFPQMSEELKDKGISVGENPVDFLLENLSTGSY